MNADGGDGPNGHPRRADGRKGPSKADDGHGAKDGHEAKGGHGSKDGHEAKDAHGSKAKDKHQHKGIELGSEFFDIYSDINGYPAASIILKQAPGSNAAEVIERIKAKLEEMKKSFPKGMNYELAYDVSHFLDASIEKVMHTLLEAFILVSLVVYMFLGDLRSTLIPTLAVPVSLVGTFFFLKLMGLSINLITLFAMVLAIGVVVDDAIVVVEAVHAKMAAKHLSPYLATGEVLHEISGAIIAITLVMVSVFIPVTFIPGPVGQFYRQFGITMATSIVLSGLVALTLTPVLCAMILKPHAHAHDDGHPAGNGHGRQAGRAWRALRLALMAVVGLAVLAGITYVAVELWGWWGVLIVLAPVVRKPFDRAVEAVTGGYAAVVRRIATRRTLTLAVVGGFAAGTVAVNLVLPTGFIPGEDQGIIYAVLQTPAGSTLEYTNSKSDELEQIAKTEFKDEIVSVTSLAGYEVLTEGRGSNAGTCILNLKDWKDRKRTAREIIAALEEKCGKLSDVKLEFFEPPAVPGFGTAGGISLVVLDKTQSSVADYKKLGEVTDTFLAALKHRQEVQNLFTFYTANYPQYELIINYDIAMQKGVSIDTALNNLNILVGSTYEQGFILFNQFYKVYVQSWPKFRRMPVDLDNLFVKSEREIEIKNEKTGKMEMVRVEGESVPYSAFMTIKKKQGLNEITRFNLYPCAVIQAAPAPGYSSGQAIKAVQEVAKQTLPRGYAIDWSGLSYDESRKGNEAVYIFIIVVAFVYLVLVGAVRELHPAAGRDPVAAGRGVRLLLLPAGDGAGQRRVRPDRAGHAGRPARQERDPDRRVRGPAAAGGPVAHGRGRGGCEAAVPADSDDLFRVRRRPPAAGRGLRGRGDREPDHRHHRGRRDARGHRHRRPGHPRPLLSVRPDRRRPKTPPG